MSEERRESGAGHFAWRYVPPNLITAASLVLGFASVLAVIDGRHVEAAWLIVYCVLLDKLDGFVARLLHAVSPFGVQMDSFTDLVTFGVCPAVLVAGVLLGGSEAEALTWMDKLPVLAGCGLYLVCNAARLARFNLLTGAYGKDYFFGWPTTLCGGLVAITFLVFSKHPEVFSHPLWYQLMPAGLAVFGVLMVSNVPLPKLKRRSKWWVDWFQMANLGFAYFCGFARWLPEYILGITMLYVIVGMIWCLFNGIRPPAPEER